MYTKLQRHPKAMPRMSLSKGLVRTNYRLPFLICTNLLISNRTIALGHLFSLLHLSERSFPLESFKSKCLTFNVSSHVLKRCMQTCWNSLSNRPCKLDTIQWIVRCMSKSFVPIDLIQRCFFRLQSLDSKVYTLNIRDILQKYCYFSAVFYLISGIGIVSYFYVFFEVKFYAKHLD